MLKKILCLPIRFLDAFRVFDFLAPLALRLYLAPVFWFSGMRNLENTKALGEWIDKTLHFANPETLAYLVTYTELGAAVCLVAGFAVRIISIPLMILMAGSIYFIHMAHGWYFVAPETAESSVRLQHFMEWLTHYFPQRAEYITEMGKLAVIQSGTEQAVAYLIMALTLFFIGSGKYFGLDYWIAKKFK